MRLYVNQKPPPEVWRDRIYAGDFFLMSGSPAATGLGDWAEECIREHFDTPEPLTDYHGWPVEKFIAATAALKSRFTNSERSKELIRSFVLELGEDPGAYFFDVPRLRVVPSYDYLHAGVSYNYAPHRDTWYGGPACQINTWMPVFPIEPDETMAIYPAYFSKHIANSSADFDLKHWIEKERGAAVKQKKDEARKHPLPRVEIDPDAEFLLAGTRGDILVFSGAHFHGSRANRGRRIRFSVDFRLFLEHDLRAGAGPEAIDDQSTNKEYGYKALFRVSDFSPYLEQVGV